MGITTIFLILILLNIGKSVRTMSLRSSKKVVFQTFAIGEQEKQHFVQCYGRCNYQQQLGEFNAIRCKGKIVNLACSSGRHLNITSATIGYLNPNLDICRHKGMMKCEGNILDNIRKTCDGVQICTLHINDLLLKETCSTVREVAMEIIYECITVISDRHIPEKVHELDWLTSNNEKNKTYHNNSNGVSNSSINKPSEEVLLHPKPNSRNSKKSIYLHTYEKLWLLSAYKVLTDFSFIKTHRIHLALALILSLFVGLAIFVCFLLDYCRRVKIRKRKDKERNENMSILIGTTCYNNKLNGNVLSKGNSSKTLNNHKSVDEMYYFNLNAEHLGQKPTGFEGSGYSEYIQSKSISTSSVPSIHILDTSMSISQTSLLSPPNEFKENDGMPYPFQSMDTRLDPLKAFCFKNKSNRNSLVHQTKDEKMQLFHKTNDQQYHNRNSCERSILMNLRKTKSMNSLYPEVCEIRKSGLEGEYQNVSSEFYVNSTELCSTDHQMKTSVKGSCSDEKCHNNETQINKICAVATDLDKRDDVIEKSSISIHKNINYWRKKGCRRCRLRLISKIRLKHLDLLLQNGHPASCTGSFLSSMVPADYVESSYSPDGL